MIISIGPLISDSCDISVGLSDEGPMAGIVFSRVSGCGDVNLGLAGGLVDAFPTGFRT